MGTEAETNKEWCLAACFLGSCSASFLIQLRTTCIGVVLTTTSWVLLYPSATRKILNSDKVPTANLMKAHLHLRFSPPSLPSWHPRLTITEMLCSSSNYFLWSSQVTQSQWIPGFPPCSILLCLPFLCLLFFFMPSVGSSCILHLQLLYIHLCFL